MQSSTSLSSTMFYSTAGMLLSLALVNTLETGNVSGLELGNSFSSETVKYLSEVDGNVAYMSKIKFALTTLKENFIIKSFDIAVEDMPRMTTFLINVEKSKDIQKLVDINMVIAKVFDIIPENDRENFITIQRMV